MATYKIINHAGNCQASRDVENLIKYITSKDKTREDGIIGGAVLPENAAEAMNAVTDAYHKERGPRVRHSVLSFSPDDPISPDKSRRSQKNTFHSMKIAIRSLPPSMRTKSIFTFTLP